MDYIVTFKVMGKHKGTNRKRTLTLNASSREEAEKIATENGLLPPLEIEKSVIEDLPTERQLAYATGLGIIVPENASKNDVSCLIDRVVERDSEPNPGLVEFAKGKGLEFSQYIGKKRLYNLIFNKLDVTNRTAFFVFSIYRWLSDDRRANLATHPEKDEFYKFAESVKGNNSFQKSLLNYSGEDLRFFGKVYNEDTRFETWGGSNRTTAYKLTAEFLRDKYNTPLTRNKAFSDNDKEAIKTNMNSTLPTCSLEKRSGEKKFSWFWFLFWVITFFPIAIIYWFIRKH